MSTISPAPSVLEGVTLPVTSAEPARASDSALAVLLHTVRVVEDAGRQRDERQAAEFVRQGEQITAIDRRVTKIETRLEVTGERADDDREDAGMTAVIRATVWAAVIGAVVGSLLTAVVTHFLH